MAERSARRVGGLAVNQIVDLLGGSDELPATNALVLRLERGARLVLRPSGTEPKLKAYFEVATEPVSPAGLGERRRRAVELMGLVESDVASRCQSIRGSSAKAT